MSSLLPHNNYSSTELRLLKTRICDLKIDYNTPQILKAIKQLHRELDQKGLSYIRPRFYLSDEWFCPDGECSIAIPFYLVNDQLKKLEKKLVGYVEGGTHEWCMRLLRHETGHCLDHLYGLSDHKQWKSFFGDKKKPYNPDKYNYNPKSLNFVTNLEDHYAQSHPLEDFAETFAVWLDPKNNWEESYSKRKKVISKLCYVDKLITNLANKPKKYRAKSYWQLSTLRITLKTHYNRRMKSQIN